MKLTMTKTLLALSISAVTSTSLAAPYEVIDLGGLEGNISVVSDINTAGQSVGYANGPLNEDGSRSFLAHAVQYDAAGNIDLGALPEGTTSEAVGINDAMVSVGFANEVETSEGQTIVRQFSVIFEGNTVTKLPTIENLSQTVAYDINNNNYVITGGLLDVDPDNQDSPTPNRAYVYDRNNDQYLSIEPFSEGDNLRSFVTSINENGDIVGFADKDEGGGFRVTSYITNVSDVSDKTEIPTNDNLALFARSINENKEVVGNIFIRGTRDQREAFYIDMSASSPELKLLGFFDARFDDSRANDINSSGQIVGRALISEPTLNETGAFLYEDDELKNLNELIACDSPWRLTEARAINDAGQIVGIGEVSGEVRAFRLDPTGEPVEDCGTEEPGPSDGGGSLPVAVVAILAALGLRRRLR